MWVKLKSKWKGNEAGKIMLVEDDAQAKGLIDAELAEEAADPTKDAVEEAGKQFDLKLKSFGKEIAEETMTKFMSAAKGKGPLRVGIETHDNEVDEPLLGFKSGPDFWFNFAKAQRGDEDAKKKIFGDGGYVKKLNARFKATGQSEAIDSEGGIFVLPEYSTDLLTVAAQLAKVRQFVRAFTMAGTSYSIRARVDKNHTVSVAGGITVSRKGEGKSPDKSKAEWEWITFKPTKLTGYIAITDELMEDAPAFASLFPPMFGEAIASQEEADFLTTGTGAGEPLAAFHANNPALVTVAKDAGQAAATITLANVLKMIAQCYKYESAVWVASQTTIPALGSINNGNYPIFVTDAKAAFPMTLFGRPIFFSEHAETLGTQGDLMLMSGSEYGVADRGGLHTATSMHVKFLEGEEVMKVWRRGDGQPLWRAPLTPVKGNTISPFVRLATRA